MIYIYMLYIAIAPVTFLKHGYDLQFVLRQSHKPPYASI